MSKQLMNIFDIYVAITQQKKIGLMNTSNLAASFMEFSKYVSASPHTHAAFNRESYAAHRLKETYTIYVI